MLAQPRTTDLKYDVAGFIARLQGVQEGHLRNVKRGLENAQTVQVMIGSRDVLRDTRNPFTYEEREEVLRQCIAERFPEDAHRIRIAPLNDTPYNKKAWIEQVQMVMRSASSALRPRYALVGNIRDATSEYLTWFPAYDYLPVSDSGTNATAIRRAFFSGNVDFDSWSDAVDWREVPRPTVEFLRKFRDKPVYAYLMNQLAAEIAYKKKWGEGPFQTVDGVVRYGDHILVIERGGPEGTGMCGLPGGFLNAGEKLLWGAAREVVEETGLFILDTDLQAMRAWLGACKKAEQHKLPAPQMPDFVVTAIRKLISFLVGHGERFDDPNRSRRGHLITEAFLFDLPVGLGFPRVLGLDDAKDAYWKATSEIRPQETFEDHAHIIDYMLTHHASF